MTTTVTSHPLSTALRLRTADAHERAENAAFMSSLLHGESGPDSLVALLTQSLPVYSALERACAGLAEDPRFSPVHDEALARTAALAADLDVHRAAGRTCDRILPSTEAYVAEIENGRQNPPALVGHHYVRYLGDLSGGQIISRLVRRHYELTEGLSFYDFDIAKPKVYKDDYRAALDGLPFSTEERDEVVAAAVRSFDLTFAMFEELGELTSGG